MQSGCHPHSISGANQNAPVSAVAVREVAAVIGIGIVITAIDIGAVTSPVAVSSPAMVIAIARRVVGVAIACRARAMKIRMNTAINSIDTMRTTETRETGADHRGDEEGHLGED